MYDAGEVERLHETGELRALYTRYDGRAYGSDEVCVALTDEEGVCVEASNSHGVPLSMKVSAKYHQNSS